jgi:ribosome-associated protein
VKEAERNVRRRENDPAVLSAECARIIVDKKGSDVLLLDLRRINSYFDYFLIATGNSRIHCRALARELEKSMLARGLRSRNRPDYESGWIVIDFGELIAHIFTGETRDYYQLEKLWGDAERRAF